MAFLKVKDESGKRRLYLFLFTHPNGDNSVKIGVASGESSVERMLQQIRSYFMMFRTTPMIAIKRDREIPAEEVFSMETKLHQYFCDRQYKCAGKWDGSTEHFSDVSVEEAVWAYTEITEGREITALPPGFDG